MKWPLKWARKYLSAKEFREAATRGDIEGWKPRPARAAPRRPPAVAEAAPEPPAEAPPPSPPAAVPELALPPAAPAEASAPPPPALARRRRQVRRSRPRSRSIAARQLTKEEIEMGKLLFAPEVDRPTNRGECKDMPRPCPFVSCSHHLYLDVNPETGSIKLNFPDLEVWELKETCSLDVADQGGITLEEVGGIMNLTRERIRQVEVRGLLRVRINSIGDGLLGEDQD